jgi:hypothetical protein
MTLFWWKNGASRESLEVLQNLGLSKCFDSAQAMVRSVADFCIEDARVAARDPAGFMGNWDNVNISTSESVEQRSGGPAKVQSGTYAILYRLRNPNPRAMALACESGDSTRSQLQSRYLPLSHTEHQHLLELQGVCRPCAFTIQEKHFPRRLL